METPDPFLDFIPGQKNTRHIYQPINDIDPSVKILNNKTKNNLLIVCCPILYKVPEKFLRVGF